MKCRNCKQEATTFYTFKTTNSVLRVCDKHKRIMLQRHIVNKMFTSEAALNEYLVEKLL